MKILNNRVLVVDNELKKFHVDWMKAQIITELWKLKIKRAQKLAVFLHFKSSCRFRMKGRRVWQNNKKKWYNLPKPKNGYDWPPSSLLLVQKTQKTKRVDMKKMVRPEPWVTPHEFNLRSLTCDWWYVCWLKAECNNSSNFVEATVKWATAD